MSEQRVNDEKKILSSVVPLHTSTELSISGYLGLQVGAEGLLRNSIIVIARSLRRSDLAGCCEVIGHTAPARWACAAATAPRDDERENLGSVAHAHTSTELSMSGELHSQTSALTAISYFLFPTSSIFPPKLGGTRSSPERSRGARIRRSVAHAHTSTELSMSGGLHSRWMLGDFYTRRKLVCETLLS